MTFNKYVYQFPRASRMERNTFVGGGRATGGGCDGGGSYDRTLEPWDTLIIDEAQDVQSKHVRRIDQLSSFRSCAAVSSSPASHGRSSTPVLSP